MSKARAGGPPRGGRGFDLEDFVIDYGKPEHAAQLFKNKKDIIAYIRREGEKEAVLIATALEQGVLPTITVPPRPARIKSPDNMGAVPPDMIDDEAEVLIWQGELKLIPSRCANLREGLVTAFSIIFDQCVPTLRKKLEQLDDWEDIFNAKDPIRLFAEITNIVQDREAHQQPIYSLIQGLKMLFTFRLDSMSNTKFLEVQDALYEALVQQGCNLVLAFPGFVEEEAERLADAVARPDDERPHPDDVTAAITTIRNSIKANLGLSSADNCHHKPLKDNLENAYSCGRDEYPAYSPTHLLTLLENFRAPHEYRQQQQQRDQQDRPRLVPEEGVNFAQDCDSGETEGGTKAAAGVQLYIDAALADDAEAEEPTCPPVSRAGVSQPPSDLMICCACGSTAHNLDRCPEVTDEMLAEILLQLEEVSPEGTGTRCRNTGFPYIDLDDSENNAAIIMVQTVRENFEGFTRKEVEHAIAARKAQALAGHPSERVFKHEVSRKSSSSLFRSCPITSQDISNARTIFGPSVACARGKWVRGKSPRVEPGYVSIPANLITFQYDILATDVMFVCGAPFLLTLSRKIWFVTVQFVPRRTAGELHYDRVLVQYSDCNNSYRNTVRV
ncbi:hypothetical protein ACHAWO_009882 [Cyclotella atomus]|uniref:Uncharacterized protein n=1 Tax=Cyclotella atomus TaxID=382360 RepID=A0ABD3NCD3_9STRA